MTAKWIDEAVRTFGRQMGLSGFSLGEGGTAGVTFENGVTLRFETSSGALLMLVGVPAGDEAQLKRLLTAAHPSAQRGRALRAVRLTGAAEDVLAVRLTEREVTVDALSREFRMLWEAARGVAGGQA